MHFSHTGLRFQKHFLIVIAVAVSLLFSNNVAAQATPPPAPTITSFSPLSACQGTAVTITGTNFTGATNVKVGSKNAQSFTVSSPTSISAVIDKDATSGNISVTTPDGTATSAAQLTILLAPQPSLNDDSNPGNPFTNCDGNNSYVLKVSNTSSIPAGGSAYTIDWGDGTAQFNQWDWPLGAQTSHTYNGQGYFNITLTIKSQTGCTKSTVYTFYNGTNPLASFSTTSSTTGLCAPAAVEFQIGNWFNNSPGTTYDIDFGDNTAHVVLTHPLSATNITYLLTHNYTTSSCPAKDFKATLNVINGCYITTYTLNQIVIRSKPAADFGSSPLNPCINDPVCFTNNTINGTSGNVCITTSTFKWDFGDGATSTLEDPPCHTYAASGTYTVTLTASNTGCGSDVKTKQVKVNPKSQVPVAGGPVAYCQGETAVPLTATGTTLLWYNSATGGTGSPIAPTPSTATAGVVTYYVSQTLPGNCESDRVPVKATINAKPAAPGVTTPVDLCYNQTATQLTASGSGLLWYGAASGGTGNASAPTPSTTSTGATNYYVSQTVNGCEGPRAMITVNVNPLPSTPGVTSPVIYCQGQQASPLTATGSNLFWYTIATGGVGASVAPTPSTTTVGSTTYYVSQKNGCGESARVPITVTVNASPTASISYSPSTLCNNSTGINPPVTVSQTGATGGVYSISPSTGLPINTTTGTITPSGATAGTYTITYTIAGTGGCADYHTSAQVIITKTPTATITYPAICSSNGATTVSLTGSSGGTFSAIAGLTLNTTNGTITPTTSTPGTYTVTYTIAAAAPCPGFTTTTSVTITKAPSATIAYQPANLCNSINTATTPNPVVPVIQTGTPNGTYTIAPATGLLIDANTGTINPSGATAGTYTIKYNIAGAGGCANYSVAATVTVNSTPTASISYPLSPYCGANTTPQPVTFSGTTGGTFSSTAGLTLNASSGTITPATSTPGTYTVTYTLAAAAPCPGFTTTTTVTITESPVITFSNNSQQICSGETAIFNPSSTVVNTTYTWALAGTLPANVTGITSGAASGANPAITLSFTNTGTTPQTLTIKVIPTNPAQNPCAGAPYNLTLIVKPATPAPVTTDAALCMGATPTALAVTPLPGNTIKWYDKNQLLLSQAPVVQTNVAAQYLFYVSQTNSYGCESGRSPITATVHLTAKIVSAISSNPSTCGIPSGSITLSLLDLNNGAVPNIPVVVHYNKFQTPLTFTGTTNAAGKITIPLTAGTYSNIYVSTTGSCLSQAIPDVFILKDPTPPSTPVAGYNPPICSGQALTLTALSTNNGAPIQYVWAGPAFGANADTVNNSVITFPSAAVSDAGTYVVYATQNNCISPPVTFSVSVIQGPSKPLINTRTPLCVGDELFLQASSSIPGNATLNYLWTGPGSGFPVNATTAGINKVAITDGGIYSITVSSPQTGCSTTTDTLIQVGNYPVIKFPQDTFILPAGYHLTLSPVITNANDPNVLPIRDFTWTPSQDLTCNDATCATPVAMIKKDICYSVKVTNIFGCSASDDVCIRVFCQNSQVFIPNAFAPNGNVPENTKLIVRGTGIASVKSFRVFNRWGRIMFERSNFSPNSAESGWDGRVNGKLADTGVYVYTVEVICENGIPYTFKGNVTLF